MENVISPTPETFTAEVLESDVAVLVDYWAGWCPPCRALAPILERIAADYDGVVKVAKVDVEEHPDLADLDGVSALPTLVLYRDGRPVRRVTGLRRHDELIAELELPALARAAQ